MREAPSAPKTKSGKQEVERILCSPAKILNDVIALLNVQASSKGLELALELSGSIPIRIETDPTRLRQILINLIGNAIKFSEAGQIRVLARLRDARSDVPRLQVDVLDSGIGMSEEELGKLFKPFVQADSSTVRRFGGTGLGLAISKQFAEMLGGEIRVQSVPGEGSTFSLTVATGPLEGVARLGS